MYSTKSSLTFLTNKSGSSSTYSDARSGPSLPALHYCAVFPRGQQRPGTGRVKTPETNQSDTAVQPAWHAQAAHGADESVNHLLAIYMTCSKLLQEHQAAPLVIDVDTCLLLSYGTVGIYVGSINCGVLLPVGPRSVAHHYRPVSAWISAPARPSTRPPPLPGVLLWSAAGARPDCHQTAPLTLLPPTRLLCDY